MDWLGKCAVCSQMRQLSHCWTKQTNEQLYMCQVFPTTMWHYMERIQCLFQVKERVMSHTPSTYVHVQIQSHFCFYPRDLSISGQSHIPLKSLPVVSPAVVVKTKAHFTPCPSASAETQLKGGAGWLRIHQLNVSLSTRGFLQPISHTMCWCVCVVFTDA